MCVLGTGRRILYSSCGVCLHFGQYPAPCSSRLMQEMLQWFIHDNQIMGFREMFGDLLKQKSMYLYIEVWMVDLGSGIII